MKKILTLLSVSLLVVSVNAWAQSPTGLAKGQRGASPAPVNNGSKATNSQLEGKGVPYGKDKEQQQSRAAAKGSTPATNRSATNSGSSTSGKAAKSANKSGAQTGSSPERNQ